MIMGVRNRIVKLINQLAATLVKLIGLSITKKTVSGGQVGYKIAT